MRDNGAPNEIQEKGGQITQATKSGRGCIHPSYTSPNRIISFKFMVSADRKHKNNTKNKPITKEQKRQDGKYKAKKRQKRQKHPNRQQIRCIVSYLAVVAIVFYGR